MAAERASPLITASWRWPTDGTGKPSLRHTQPGRATRASASDSAARFVLWRPRRWRRSEEPDAVGRPVGGEGASDDPFLGDRPPEAAVVGGATVVAHHEPMAGRNANRFRESAVGASAALSDERLLRLLPVAD